MRHAAAFAFPLFASLLVACALSACGGNDKAGARRADGSTADALPAPERASGSVTGMPDAPGPGQPDDADNPDEAPGPVTAVDEYGNEIAIDADPDADDANPAPAAEPTSEEAVDALQQYYSAIEAGDFGTAYALWADGGRASGQTPDQFAAGFAQTSNLSPMFDAPARVEGAVGSRFIEVPVAVEATLRDGTVKRYVGAYVLRRSVVEGATDEQREWRIASADLREVTQ
jgi:hypothetical protein